MGPGEKTKMTRTQTDMMEITLMILRQARESSHGPVVIYIKEGTRMMRGMGTEK